MIGDLPATAGGEAVVPAARSLPRPSLLEPGHSANQPVVVGQRTSSVPVGQHLHPPAQQGAQQRIDNEVLSTLNSR